MYRGGELLDTVEQTFAFLDNVSSAGTVRGPNPVPRQPSTSADVMFGTWHERQQPSSTRQRSQVKYWEPRYKSVRDMPGFSSERSLPRSMDWEQRKIQEERIAIVRQKEWEREKARREEERREAERREIERAREEQWRQSEKLKELERLRIEEEEQQIRIAERQRSLKREKEEEQLEQERALERKRILEADKIKQVEVRRWKVHPPQMLDPTDWTALDKTEKDVPERVRHWDVHPSVSDDLRKHWNDDEFQQTKKDPPLGNYVAPPRVPREEVKAYNRQDSYRSQKEDNNDGSALLKRTNHYLDAIDRMQAGSNHESKVKEPPVIANNIPKPPDMSGLATFTPKPPEPTSDQRFIAERIKDLKDVGPAPPPPPPMPTANNIFQHPGHTPQLQDVQYARSTLKPIEKRIVEDKTYEPEPKTFKEKLNRLLEFQLAAQRWDITKPPVMESYMKKSDNDPQRYKTVKTLSKVAMKDKLEVILVQGPSFRGSAELEEKRQNVAANFRSGEQQKMNVEAKVLRRTGSSNRKSILPIRQQPVSQGHRWRQPQQSPPAPPTRHSSLATDERS